jgi:epoxyqueuosine reductase QueG
MKEKLRSFALSLGVDDVGFASMDDYRSPLSPRIDSLFPSVRSIIVLAFRESSSCVSPSPQVAMNGRLDVMAFIRASCYQLVRFVEGQLGSPAMSIGFSYPMDLVNSQKAGIAEVSLRHAAVGAGLGVFGRHNLVIHPRFGTRVVFGAVLTKLELASDRALEVDYCTGCELCVQACPAGALDVEGKTDRLKCMGISQPYGIQANISFWSRYSDASPAEKKAMLDSPEYRSLWQANFIGNQYFCFRCFTVCPAGSNPKVQETALAQLPRTGFEETGGAA